MGFLIYMFIKLTMKLMVLSVWVCWALVALTVALSAGMTGHDQAARQWTRSLNWRHLF